MSDPMKAESGETPTTGEPPVGSGGGRRDLFDHAFWEAMARSSPELRDNPAGTEHLVRRFLGKYLPRLLLARTEDDLQHVWLAYWSYLIARASWKKPFGLSHQAADDLIAQFKSALGPRGHGAGK